MTQDLSKLTVDELFKLGGVEVYDGLHFVYTGDDHGPGYAQLRPLGQVENLPILKELSYRTLKKALEALNLPWYFPVVVVGPETLGVKIAAEAVTEYKRRETVRRPIMAGAFMHDPNKEDGFIWGDGGGFALMQPDPKSPPAQVVWVDDLMNKGSTWKRSKNLLLDLWPDSVKAIATIANRSAHTSESLGVPHFVSLHEISLDRFSPAECRQCEQHIPIVRHPGHGWKFEEANPNYLGGYMDL